MIHLLDTGFDVTVHESRTFLTIWRSSSGRLSMVRLVAVRIGDGRRRVGSWAGRSRVRAEQIGA